ncbi:MFS transporter [Natranaerovirga hydrolytica]|uniref:MFS transporter n=1 Tax=Natranaerovirga hydrolytica TaxID=680378 RepID=A0A4R1MYT9_9FIRM|nr:OFA family MFS transporter [Natranaerovirga hydrolytica]TCK98477.1 MFS transporter [Natranaerovirga hydrolytica]
MKKQYTYVVTGIIIMLCLGTVYSWSIFRGPLEEVLNISPTLSGLPYMFFLLFYALLMPIGGIFIEKFGPRVTIMIGGILVGLGWIISGLVGNIYLFIISYGIIAGSGVGIAYGAPLAVVTRLYPKNKGFLSGMILLGFGLSPFITAPLSNRLIKSFGLQETFIILGIVFLIIVTAFSFVFSYPSHTNVSINKQSFNLKTLTQNKVFYGLCFCFVLGTLVGLMMIGITVPVGQEIIGLSTREIAILMSVFAFFNAIGRPIFGLLTDRFSPRLSAILSFSMILLASILMVFANKGTPIIFIVAFIIYWFNLGGWLAIAPTSTAIYFGDDNYSKNYGYVFLSYGVGAILGTLISGEIRNVLGSYAYVFPFIIIIAIIGIISSIVLLNKVETENTNS